MEEQEGIAVGVVFEPVHGLDDLKVGISDHPRIAACQSLGRRKPWLQVHVGYNAAGSPSVALKVSPRFSAPTAKRGSRPVVLARNEASFVRRASSCARIVRPRWRTDRSPVSALPDPVHLPLSARRVSRPMRTTRRGLDRASPCSMGLPMKTRSAEAPPAFSRRVFRDRVTVSPAHVLVTRSRPKSRHRQGFHVVCCTCVGCSPDRAVSSMSADIERSDVRSMLGSRASSAEVGHHPSVWKLPMLPSLRWARQHHRACDPRWCAWTVHCWRRPGQTGSCLATRGVGDDDAFGGESPG